MIERLDIVPMGELQELGVVANEMHSRVIRPERLGEPSDVRQLRMRQQRVIGSDFLEENRAAIANG